MGTGDPEEDRRRRSPQIIERLNDRFGTEFTDADRLFFEQIKESAVQNEGIRQTALANPLDKFKLGVRGQIQQLMYQRMGDNDALVSRYMNEPEFQSIVFEGLIQEIFKAVGGAKTRPGQKRTHLLT